MKVLVVEDDPKILSFVRMGLREQGFTVETCGDGDEAYARATTEAHDAIVLDIMLPGRDGLSILRALRGQKNTVPVILLTARSSLGERVEGLDLRLPPWHEAVLLHVHLVTRCLRPTQFSARSIASRRGSWGV